MAKTRKKRKYTRRVQATLGATIQQVAPNTPSQNLLGGLQENYELAAQSYQDSRAELAWAQARVASQKASLEIAASELMQALDKVIGG